MLQKNAFIGIGSGWSWYSWYWWLAGSRRSRHPILPLSLAQRIVLLDFFVNSEDAIGPVVVAHQDSNIRNTANFASAIRQGVPDSITHQILIQAGPCTRYRLTQKLILTARPTSP